jgi:MFS family permease
MILSVFRRLSTFRALRHRSYRLYFGGQLFSVIGTWLHLTALMWLTYEITHQSSWTANVGAARLLPTVFLAPLGGMLADRFSKRSLLIITQVLLLLLALALAVLTVTVTLTGGHLLLLTLLAGIIHAVDWPARLAFVSEMVERQDLANAVALNSLLFNCARAIGPALAGLFYAWQGPAFCFLLNALTFVPLIIALVAMPIPARGEALPGTVGGGAFLSGVKHLVGRPRLLALLLLTAAMAFFAWPILPLLPALAKQTFHGDESTYGTLLSGVGAGALTAALAAATIASHIHEERDRRRDPRIVVLAVGAGLVACSLLCLACTSNLFAGVAACFLFGLGMILFLATSQSITQLSALDHNRGAVMGVWSMLLSAAQPAGYYLAGWTADESSVTTVLALQGVGVVASAVLAGLFIRRRVS